jgi:hypothetical protein
MRVRVPESILTIMAVVSFTSSLAFAGFPGNHHHSQKSASVDIVDVTKIPGGPTLEPGTYEVTLLNASSAPEVGFYQAGKLVGQAPVKLVDQDRKISETEIRADKKPDHTQVVTEMDLRGWTQKLMFEKSNAMGG